MYCRSWDQFRRMITVRELFALIAVIAFVLSLLGGVIIITAYIWAMVPTWLVVSEVILVIGILIASAVSVNAHADVQKARHAGYSEKFAWDPATRNK